MTEDQESQLDQMQTAEDGIPSSTTQDTDDIPLAMVEDESDMNFRDSKERPVYKLSVKLIDTYKHINKVYYEAKAKRLQEQKESNRAGVHNDGYDDVNYDYILQGDEILNDRYILKHKMGKGSFGQVVCAYDRHAKCEVAIKIIKSRKPFLIQAKTEIDILNKISSTDVNDESNIVKLLDHFIYRNHQCLVFEILSFNLYELLKNTRFRGVSLTLVRKFSTQLLKAMEFLARPDVNIIHCDLKPENILLRHPRRSAIKMIDFGSSCYENKRTYSYIQSRFYRSPEVLYGLPYSQKIDMWSLGCVVVEMHTGEPLFGGSNQVDQVCRICDVMGVPPLSMIQQSPVKKRKEFFEKIEKGTGILPSPVCDINCIVHDDATSYYILKRPNKSLPKPQTLRQIIGVDTGGPSGRRQGENDHSQEKYLEFLDFVQRMLVYDPDQRATPTELLQHPYILSVPESALTTPAVVANSTVAGDMAIVDETGATKALNSDNIQSRKRVAPDNSEENAAMQVDDQSSANSSMHNQKNSRLDDQIVPESSNVGSEMDSKNDTWSSSNIHKLRSHSN